MCVYVFVCVCVCVCVFVCVCVRACKMNLLNVVRVERDADALGLGVYTERRLEQVVHHLAEILKTQGPSTFTSKTSLQSTLLRMCAFETAISSRGYVSLKTINLIVSCDALLHE